MQTNGWAGNFTASLIVVLICLICNLFCASAANAGAEKEKPGEWESTVLSGNAYRDRSRYSDARKVYNLALKILDKRGINDLRRAIVLDNLADCYRNEQNFTAARLLEVRATTIYEREIASHQIGYEYSKKKPVDFNSGSLRPMCYLCHENWKVVPILYGKTNGYDGEVPSEDDAAFTHKPGGENYSDQRWYCRDCHQSF